jgi:hypothetical protein
VARTFPPPRKRTYRFLLDQNFPEAPIEMARLDATIELVHLRSFDTTLTEPRTPDWYIYLRAAEAGFQALVTRDWHQVEQPEELWVLENLALSVVSWRDGVEDSIVEFGQLLAYLPQIKRHLETASPRVVLLPRPQLTRANFVNPRERLGQLAADEGVAHGELRDHARATVETVLNQRGELGRLRPLLDRSPRQ